jgi:phosphatidylinositol alpha-1,6-mannosyltransferase
MRNHCLFLTLNIFTATGGIEKVCRVAGKALYEKSVLDQQRLMIWSMHDQQGAADNNTYFPSELYRTFGAKKAAFVKAAVAQGAKSDLVILSHINLLTVAWMIKKVSPQTRIILMAHGIEIWNKVSSLKSKMLGAVNEFWAVSEYTRQRVMASHSITPKNISVLNNCLDPNLPLPKNIVIPKNLYQRYGIKDGDKFLFTLTRLSSKERYKGYDKVIEALKALQRNDIKYIIAGKADAPEAASMEADIREAGLQHQVILAGFLPDAELAAHFMMSDLYIMPSSKEGFGIVFIEAMYYGLPVIGGNADGTMDALLNGNLGTVVTPGNVAEIKTAIETVLSNREKHIPDHNILMDHFGYETYKKRLEKLLN